MTRSNIDGGPFAIGELVEVIGFEESPQILGRDAVIIAGLAMRATRDGPTYEGYRCEVQGLPTKYQISARNLRRKRPPPQREQTSTWDDVIVWRPKAVEVPA